MHGLRHVHFAIAAHPDHLPAAIGFGGGLIGLKHHGRRNVTDIERRLLSIEFGERRLVRIRLHQLLGAPQAFRIRHVLRHGIGEFDTGLALLLKTRDCGQNGTISLRDIHSARGERTAVAQLLHVEQQILTDIAGSDEIAVDGMRQT